MPPGISGYQVIDCTAWVSSQVDDILDLIILLANIILNFAISYIQLSLNEKINVTVHR